ncbi:bifunctional diguanylate cyclase/phosphodiesterase [Pleionea sp. CnH1-48]|uniref:putative bifunctional diguanylate cyclase/phosphodiesterase n=1 Tax=Pleionea sp. CnH1-48 TaxID=2954494 RepID=UPI0020984733|nr:EAL domain-containing protein [Pleionea sp. CnH1-48]MCO7225096.1 EAL domain-containing protein [Pleionea sp. CnH1-48]
MAAALLVGAFIFVFEMLFVVQTLRDDTRDLQGQVLNLAESPATNAAWHLDNGMADSMLEGLLAIDTVKSGRIVLADGVLQAEVTKERNFVPSMVDRYFHFLFADLDHVSRQLLAPDWSSSPAEREVIADLYIEFDTLKTSRRFVKLIGVGFWSSIIRSFLLALVLGIVFHRFLTRPIMKIGENLKKVDPGSLDFKYIPNAQGHEKGELFSLVCYFNDMLHRLATTQQNLRRMATRDPLTKLPNRALIHEELGSNIRRSLYNQRQFALLFMDLDRFKYVNDTLGHVAGDELLCELAERFRTQLPASIRVGRLGGDEFVFIVEKFDNHTALIGIVEDILSLVKTPVKLNELSIEPCASIGIAIYPDDGKDIEQLMRHADIAMYCAKANSAEQYTFFEAAMIKSSEARFQIENCLHFALENNEMMLYVQPKVKAGNRKLDGCEILLRWRLNGQVISPATFIPIAEETHLIVPIGFWLIEEVCKLVRKWLDWGIEIKVALNVSPRQLECGEFISTLKNILSRYPECTSMLEFEITESTLMTNLEAKLRIIKELRALGISVAIDDFGTGYSSLAYLRRLQLDTLKIDQSFVSDIPYDIAIPASIIELAKQLGLKTVAEGVENQDQFNWLTRKGCDLIQGYLIGRPVSVEDFEEEFLKQDKRTTNSTLIVD